MLCRGVALAYFMSALRAEYTLTAQSQIAAAAAVFTDRSKPRTVARKHIYWGWSLLPANAACPLLAQVFEFIAEAGGFFVAFFGDGSLKGLGEGFLFGGRPGGGDGFVQFAK